jgi:hypothetical protein
MRRKLGARSLPVPLAGASCDRAIMINCAVRGKVVSPGAAVRPIRQVQRHPAQAGHPGC